MKRGTLLLGVVCVLLASPSANAARPQGRQEPRPLVSQVEEADVVCFAELLLIEDVNAQIGPFNRIVRGAGRYGNYNVIRVAKDSRSRVHPLDDIKFNLWQNATRGEFYLFVGNYNGTGGVFWSMPTLVTEDQFDFATQVPPPDARPGERIAYFLGFLGSSDKRIAADSSREVMFSSYSELVAARDRIPKTMIDEWVRWFGDRDESPDHRAISARLLGVFGTERDAARLEAALFGSRPDERFGLKEIASGYLALKGQAGLEKLDEWVKKQSAFSAHDARAVLDALWVMGDELPERIPRDRLLRSIRPFLDRPDQVRRAITLLAGLEDWSVRDRVVRMYMASEEEMSAPRGEIAKYLFAAKHAKLAGPQGIELRNWAERSLNDLRRIDSKRMARIERALGEEQP
jgi:hypothetical protein